MTLSRRDLLSRSARGFGAAALLSMMGGPAAGATTLTRAPGAPTLSVVAIREVSGRQLPIVAALDDVHALTTDGARQFLLWPGDEAKLVKAGIRYEVVDADVLSDLGGVRTALPQPGETETGDYRLPADYLTHLQDLAAAFPDLCRYTELATPSLQGRAVGMLEIASNPGARDGRPVVHHDGMHHCREWPAGEMPIMWAYDLLENYGTDPVITQIVDNTRQFIIPLVNPDGYEESRMALVDLGQRGVNSGPADNDVTGRSFWRKNRRIQGEPPLPVLPEDYGAIGIDLNRNYPFLWGDDTGSSSSTSSETYRGTAPYSEPESHNVRDVIRSTAPIMAITHHTSGRIMLYPWGRDPDEVRSPDWEVMQDLGDEMAVFNGYRPQQAFNLYPTSGTSRDWAHAATSTLIYTFEHTTAFHPAYASTIPDLYASNRGAFILHSQMAFNPASHAVISGRVADSSGRPIEGATVRVTRLDGLTPTAQDDLVPDPIDTVMDVGEDGTFAFHVPPSTRPFLAEEIFGGPVTEPWRVVVEAPGHEPRTIPVTVGRGDEADLDGITLV